MLDRQHRAIARLHVDHRQAVWSECVERSGHEPAVVCIKLVDVELTAQPLIRGHVST
jgi:hypothetical protein